MKITTDKISNSELCVFTENDTKHCICNRRTYINTANTVCLEFMLAYFNVHNRNRTM